MARRSSRSHGRMEEFLKRIKRIFKREPELPDDPYALVGAPKKPRTPRRGAAAAEPLD